MVLIALVALVSSCDSNNPSQDQVANSSFATAETLANGSSIEAATGSAVLYYKFTLDTPAVSVIRITNSDAREWQVYFYDSRQMQTAGLIGKVSQGESFEKEDLLDRGQYFFTVQRPEGVQEIESFTISFEVDDSDEYELNNAIEDSKQIDLGQEISAAFRPGGDVDYYTFEKTDADIFLEATVSNTLDFEILRENGNQVTSGSLITNRGVESSAGIFLDRLSSGVYIIKLSNRRIGAPYASSYSFRLE